MIYLLYMIRTREFQLSSSVFLCIKRFFLSNDNVEILYYYVLGVKTEGCRTKRSKENLFIRPALFIHIFEGHTNLVEHGRSTTSTRIYGLVGSFRIPQAKVHHSIHHLTLRR